MANEHAVWVRHSSITLPGNGRPVIHDVVLFPTHLKPDDVDMFAAPRDLGAVKGPQGISNENCRDLCAIANRSVKGVTCSQMHRAPPYYEGNMVAGNDLVSGMAGVNPDFSNQATISAERIEPFDAGPIFRRYRHDGKIRERIIDSYHISDAFEAAVNEGIVPCMEDGEIGIFNPDIVTVQPSHPAAPQLKGGIQNDLFHQ